VLLSLQWVASSSTSFVVNKKANAIGELLASKRDAVDYNKKNEIKERV
jgi:hypothetical protein